LEIARDALERLRTFEATLYEANAVMNLTRVPRAEFQVRHVRDSLLIAEFCPEGAEVLDIGTGAGFPAWPLACCRPDLQVTALDSLGKATRFLETIPLPNLKIVNARGEAWGVREQFDVVTGRALAPLAIQLELSAAPCKVGGVLVPMRTPAERGAIEAFPATALGLALERIELRTLEGAEIVRCFPVFRKTTRTPPTFPRKWAEIRKNPIR